MRTSEARPILDAFGYLQHGLITASQAAESGIDTTTLTRLHQRDLLRRVRRGVYILAGVAEDSLTDIRAAWLATSPRVLAEERLEDASPIVVSYASAASVLELGNITPAHHTFTSPTRKQSSAADIRHRLAPLSKDETVLVEGLPVTSALRTTVDLAKDHLDGDQLHQVIANAIHDHRVSASQISQRLDPFVEIYGYGSGKALVAEALKRFPEDERATEAAQFAASSYLAEMFDSKLLQRISGALGASEFPSVWDSMNTRLSPQFAGIVPSRLSPNIIEALSNSQTMNFGELMNARLGSQLSGLSSENSGVLGTNKMRSALDAIVSGISPETENLTKALLATYPQIVLGKNGIQNNQTGKPGEESGEDDG